MKLGGCDCFPLFSLYEVIDGFENFCAALLKVLYRLKNILEILSETLTPTKFHRKSQHFVFFEMCIIITIYYYLLFIIIIYYYYY